jgi:segregation and condensation protein A
VPHVETDHVLVDEVTVAEVVEALVASLPGGPPTTFRELTASAATRMELVVHFLGLLELYKQGLVELEQSTTFGELRVVWTGGLDESPDAGEIEPETVPAGSREPVSVSFGDLDYSG